MAHIEPRTLKGFRDFLPSEQIAREKMIETIKASYRTFGFEPLETPVLEYAEILTGKYGEEGDKLMYKFKDNGDRDVAMRYDLTIPLARVVAQNADLKKPFKRYQVSPVWRADNTQKGRYREFYQCDADIVGTTSLLADAEILALSSTTLQKLGVTDFMIRVNSREIIFAFYESLGLSEADKAAAIRAVDKFDKIGKEGVREELKTKGISEENAGKIVAFAETSIDLMEKRDDVNSIAQAFPAIKAPLEKLIGIIESAFELAPDTKFILDLSIARGLDYYTGIIFETSLSNAPQYGSVLSGGRYDNLVGMFANKPVPAVGTSIGFDRLFAALDEIKLIKTEKTTAEALIVNFEEALEDEYLRMAKNLREAGINTILYFDVADMKKQLSYASEKGIKFAVLYGSKEAAEGMATIKNLDSGTQDKVELAKIAQYIKG